MGTSNRDIGVHKEGAYGYLGRPLPIGISCVAQRDRLRRQGARRSLGGVPESGGGCAEEGPNLSRQGGLTAMAMRFGADGGRGIVSSARDGFF